MDLQHRPDAPLGIPLIAARQIPGHRQAHGQGSLEDQRIPPRQLRRGHPAAEGVIPVRVRAGLVDEDIAPGETVPDQARQSRQKRHRLQMCVRRPE